MAMYDKDYWVRSDEISRLMRMFKDSIRYNLIEGEEREYSTPLISFGCTGISFGYSDPESTPVIGGRQIAIVDIINRVSEIDINHLKAFPGDLDIFIANLQGSGYEVKRIDPKFIGVMIT
jgi:hypothetical protein